MKTNKFNNKIRKIGNVIGTLAVSPIIVCASTQGIIKQNNNLQETNQTTPLSDVIKSEYRNLGAFKTQPNNNLIIFTLNTNSSTWTTKDQWYQNQVEVTSIGDGSAVISAINGSQIYSGNVEIIFTIDPDIDKLDLNTIDIDRTLFTETNTEWKLQPTNEEIFERFWNVNNTLNKNDSQNLEIDNVTIIDGQNGQAVLKAKPQSYRYRGSTILTFVISPHANTGVDIYPETGYVTDNDEGILEFTPGKGEYVIEANDDGNVDRSIVIDDGADVTLTIKGKMNIETNDTNKAGIDVKPGGKATIKLEDTSVGEKTVLNITAHGSPAISAPDGATIQLCGSGDIVVESDAYGCAVIGGPPKTKSGNIEILDNINVKATLTGNNNPGVAIGAGVASVCKRIYINTTGKVEARNNAINSSDTAVFFGAAIGGGGSEGSQQPSGSVEEIIIVNGEIHAYGATMTGTNGSSGATIGSGAIRNRLKKTEPQPFGTIQINGGFVYAEERSNGNAYHRDGVPIGTGGLHSEEARGPVDIVGADGTFILNGGTVVTKSENQKDYASDVGIPDKKLSFNTLNLYINGGNLIRDTSSSADQTFSQQPTDQTTSTSLYPVYAKISDTGTTGTFTINDKTFSLTPWIDNDNGVKHMSGCSAAFYLPVGEYTTTIDGKTYNISVTANNYTFAQAQSNSKNILIPQNNN